MLRLSNLFPLLLLVGCVGAPTTTTPVSTEPVVYAVTWFRITSPTPELKCWAFGNRVLTDVSSSVWTPVCIPIEPHPEAETTKEDSK